MTTIQRLARELVYWTVALACSIRDESKRAEGAEDRPAEEAHGPLVIKL